jgi:hypothetical protein
MPLMVPAVLPVIVVLHETLFHPVLPLKDPDKELL